MPDPEATVADELAWQPRYPEFREYVREVFATSAATQLIDARLGRIDTGYVEVAIAHRPDLTQQGFVPSGVLGLLADLATTLAALTMAPRGTAGHTTELKITIVEPAFGAWIVARGRVIRPGRIVSVVAADLYAVSATGREQRAAAALASVASDTHTRPR